MNGMAYRSDSIGAQTAPLSGVVVLVVDDQPSTRVLIKDVLYASGAAQVHSAANGAEAIAMLRSCKPDLLVLDWRMPELDGLAVTQLIRQAVTHPDRRISDPKVPIVVVSGHTGAQAVEAFRRAGVNEVVAKPFTIAALLDHLMEALNNPRAFVVSNDFVGPDRRRRQGGAADKRRADDGVEILDFGGSGPGASRLSVLNLLQIELGAMEQGIDTKPISPSQIAPSLLPEHAKSRV